MSYDEILVDYYQPCVFWSQVAGLAKLAAVLIADDLPDIGMIDV